MRIGVIGGGTVGRATARAWYEHCEQVRVYDTVPQLRTHTLSEALECEIVMVCLPEANVQSFFALLGDTEVRFALRSTVTIGTTENIALRAPHIVHYPEFLTERCALEDALNPARSIVGVPGGWYSENSAKLRLCEALEARFPGAPLMVIDSTESEAAKLFCNAFFATKLALFNEFYALCQKRGLNWYATMRAVLSDGRVGDSHTRVPGHDGALGFGGKCLRKDAAMLANGVPLLKAVLESNRRIRDEDS